MPVPLKLTHHAFLDTVAGKSTISGKSSGECCWHNEDHNQEKIGKMHLPLNREQLSQDLLHCTTLETGLTMCVRGVLGRMVWVAGRTLTAQLLWQRSNPTNPLAPSTRAPSKLLPVPATLLLALMGHYTVPCWKDLGQTSSEVIHH